MITSVPNEHLLRALKNHKEGEVVFCEKEQTAFKYSSEEGWIKQELPKSNIKLGLYEANQQIISQAPDLTEEQIEEKKKMIAEFVLKQNNRFYMLNNKETNYFTLFEIEDNKTAQNPLEIQDEIIGCLTDIGTIKSIDLTSDEIALEMWAVDKETGIAHVYFLFGFDGGVIKCR